jgi:hypothetical protein
MLKWLCWCGMYLWCSNSSLCSTSKPLGQLLHDDGGCLWRFFLAGKNYDVDSMTVSNTLTDSYLWWFFYCLWPYETVMYQHNPCSACMHIHSSKCKSNKHPKHVLFLCCWRLSHMTNQTSTIIWNSWAYSKRHIVRVVLFLIFFREYVRPWMNKKLFSSLSSIQLITIYL